MLNSFPTKPMWCSAPATANILVKFAHGIADEAHQPTVLARKAPFRCPRHDVNCSAPAVIENLSTRALAASPCEPGEGSRMRRLGKGGSPREAECRGASALGVRAKPGDLVGLGVLVRPGRGGRPLSGSIPLQRLRVVGYPWPKRPAPRRRVVLISVPTRLEAPASGVRRRRSAGTWKCVASKIGGAAIVVRAAPCPLSTGRTRPRAEARDGATTCACYGTHTSRGPGAATRPFPLGSPARRTISSSAPRKNCGARDSTSSWPTTCRGPIEGSPRARTPRCSWMRRAAESTCPSSASGSWPIGCGTASWPCAAWGRDRERRDRHAGAVRGPGRARAVLR